MIFDESLNRIVNPVPFGKNGAGKPLKRQQILSQFDMPLAVAARGTLRRFGKQIACTKLVLRARLGRITSFR